MLTNFQKNVFDNFDKQIYFIKVIIWEACPFRCSYCFVDKENPIVIRLDTLKRIIDLLLFSPWKNKLLHLLGWEPLLFFDIIKKGVIYARKLWKKLNKDLDISFCTTGLYFDEEKLKFISENDIHLAWSIDWPDYIHDLNRKNIINEWTFENIIVKKAIVLKNIKNSHLGIAMTIDENTVESLFESYKYLVNIEWFTCTINIAPVDWKIWKKSKQKAFINELIKIYDYIFENIEKNRFLYLNALNKEFRFNMLSVFRNKWWRCLWFYTEAFSNGEILFNPFVNKEKDYSRYVVWNINSDSFIDGISKYIWCRFDNNSSTCNNCRQDYFNWIFTNLTIVKLNKLLKLRDKLSVFYANKIRLEAKNNNNFRKYMEIAKDQMYV